MYYDLDAILTDAQKVPCTFELDVPGLGYLDHTPTQTLTQHTRVELPLWLSEMLAGAAMGTTQAPVTLHLPAALSSRVMNALKADATSVDLRAQAPHFYGLGRRMLELIEDDEVLQVLLDSFKQRAAAVSDHAGQPADGEFLRGLDEAERQLFRQAHDSARAMRTWMAEHK